MNLEPWGYSESRVISSLLAYVRLPDDCSRLGAMNLDAKAVAHRIVYRLVKLTVTTYWHFSHLFLLYML